MVTTRIAILAALFCCLLSPASYAGQAVSPVVTDGKTVTKVSTDSSGHITVGIAPVATGVTGDISHNSYSSFSVPTAGVDLDNRGIDARMIVNEVTSNNPSLIQGKLVVLGNQAHVILANPNGITVDGGSFVNTGNVALTTGTISYKDTAITPITTQRNVVITTDKGTITIGEGGLSGAFANLELIAKQIDVSGPVVNKDTRDAAAVYLTAGRTSTEIDSSVSIVDLTHLWANTTPLVPVPAEPGAILVNIGSLGSITASRISIAVTDKGAGVRHSGMLASSIEDVSLDTQGNIDIIGGTITSATNTEITTAASVTLTGGTITVQSSIAISAGDFLAQGVRNADNSWTSSSVNAVNGGLLIHTTTGEITNIGSTLQGMTRIEGITDSVGGVTLISAGAISNQTVASDALGIIFSVNDDLSVQAANDITNNAGRLLSNKSVNITSTHGDFNNIIDKQQMANDGVVQDYSYKDGTTFFKSRVVNGWRVDYGNLIVDGQVATVSAGDNVVITANTITNTGGNIFANNGAVTFNSTALHNETVLSGSAWLETECAWICGQKGDSTFAESGGEVSAKGDITLNTPAGVTNIGGQLLTTTGNINIKSPAQVVEQSLPTYDFITLNRGLTSMVKGNSLNMMRYDQGGSFVANMGYISIMSDSPVTLDGGTIDGQQDNIIPGGITVIRTPTAKPNNVTGNNVGLLSKVL